MHGIPNILQTKVDFERVRAMAVAGECPAAAAVRHFSGLLEARWAYEFSRELADEEQPDGEMPEYLVTQTEDESVSKKVQHIRKEQPGAKLFLLGYTVADVEAIITQLEAL